MTTIRIILTKGRRQETVTIRISDITDAVEIYNAVLDTGRTHIEAVECLRLMNLGAFKIGT